MARGMTKDACLSLEGMVNDIMEVVAGECEFQEILNWRTWNFPHANGCAVTTNLHCRNFAKGAIRIDPWVSSRLIKPSDWIGENRHTKPKEDLPWPSWFTYPSGKNNWYPSNQSPQEIWRSDFLSYLFTLTADGSPERERAYQLIVKHTDMIGEKNERVV